MSPDEGLDKEPPQIAKELLQFPGNDQKKGPLEIDLYGNHENIQVIHLVQSSMV